MAQEKQNTKKLNSENTMANDYDEKENEQVATGIDVAVQKYFLLTKVIFKKYILKERRKILQPRMDIKEKCQTPRTGSGGLRHRKNINLIKGSKATIIRTNQ